MDSNLINQIPKDLRILDISVINTNLFTSEKYLENRIRPKALDLRMKRKVGFNFEKEIAKCFLFFEIKALGESSETLGLTFQIGIEFNFLINDLSKYLVSTNEGSQVMIELGSSILAIAYSTSRGIILERTNNTFFKGIIIPVIDASESLIDDSQILSDSEEE